MQWTVFYTMRASDHLSIERELKPFFEKLDETPFCTRQSIQRRRQPRTDDTQSQITGRKDRF